MTFLAARSLSSFGPPVSTPSYDRSSVRTGIVHLGVGGFHRSHQAMYLDRLMETGTALDWGICGVGVLPADRGMQEVMAAQDCLFTLVVKHPDGTLAPRVVGSMVEYLFAPDDPESVVARMADPAIRIVSLTVTEGGYNASAVTGEFDGSHPGVVNDLQPGAALRTTFGLVTEALVRRRDRGVPPFTVVSCDNIPGNGDLARSSFAAFAALRDAELGEWVRAAVPFPNSMVDRITPVTTDADRAELSRRFGVEDRWPVVCEPWTQWVLEDSFASGRPRLEDAGVQLVDDVAPYELMKLRLLNAGHQVLAQLGRLAGFEFVHEVCGDPVFRRFLEGYLEEEATPTLPSVPGIDLDRYRADLVGRFASPAIADTLDRIRAEASDRIPQFLLPVVRANLASGGEIERSVAVLAAWARSAEGADDAGRPIGLTDSRAAALALRARSEDPLAFVADRELFGDLAGDERFAAAYREARTALRERGARALVTALAQRSSGSPV
ncbi:mannitol dehydrogenase family protein [Blastococcus sp. CT_GayMR16]|uniref:mannitol dehydrogenase family protein n=1 Tax=Blastococcus sp. CT_GayMR16 TaxID=2559607 RepID=UPI001073A3C1|nr:mannitol dehydrogenase family protein [Blastococcus sp. CT_GayMR16]TFV88755.1 mannitol dehydrogenase family protein [Blastococcus sp. CT_GayMR16]